MKSVEMEYIDQPFPPKSKLSQKCHKKKIFPKKSYIFKEALRVCKVVPKFSMFQIFQKKKHSKSEMGQDFLQTSHITIFLLILYVTSIGDKLNNRNMLKLSTYLGHVVNIMLKCSIRRLTKSVWMSFFMFFLVKRRISSNFIEFSSSVV